MAIFETWIRQMQSQWIWRIRRTRRIRRIRRIRQIRLIQRIWWIRILIGI